MANVGAAQTVARVRRARFVVFRTFDVCDTALLADAERLLLEARVARTSIQFRAPPRRELGALLISAAPLNVDLGQRSVNTGNRELSLSASVRIFDHGTLSVAFECDIERGADFDDLAQRAAELAGLRAFDELARAEYDALCKKIGPALRGVHGPREILPYLVLFVEELEPPATVELLLSWPGLPKFCASEVAPRDVSSHQREDVMRYTDGYLDDDAVVIGSACALVVEPTGCRDVLDILELVRAQMVQLRNYDDQLDREISDAHSHFESKRFSLALYSPFGTKLRRLSGRLLELTAFSERIENALKVVADAYLARIYRKTVERFAVTTLKARVAHKQKLLMDVYVALKDEVQILRSFTVEVLILMLILTEIVLAIVGR